MREAAFVRQNKDKWAAFENALHNKGQHPDLPEYPSLTSTPKNL